MIGGGVRPERPLDETLSVRLLHIVPLVLSQVEEWSVRPTSGCRQVPASSQSLSLADEPTGFECLSQRVLKD